MNRQIGSGGNGTRTIQYPVPSEVKVSKDQERTSAAGIIFEHLFLFA
jgi:hypothetical protein